MPSSDRRRPHYAWAVYGATLAILLLAAGFRASPSVLIDPLHDEFGWSNGEIGLAVSVNVLLFGLMGPFAAALLAKFGLRRVVLRILVANGQIFTVNATLTDRML